ncbi:phosphopeptide-binding protein [Nocardiopsis gilva YIM 90087]|uniref:Phosphopeptide-binding protein n=1 Tax=Nocardiopsis gilva YIM 90087 TaxID=1235441 RepID=A0A223SCG4_9ACTN|nr:FHA domain-containing protein [Nocardiopsis gilva]ASU85861.1 phosphopeptide-binding protein [Nocardiopsis gilva YIM 90087]
MPTCPAGHASAAGDFCDFCGIGIPTPPYARRTEVAQAQRAENCPECGTPRAGRFCEECGHDFSLADQTVASSLPITPPSEPSSNHLAEPPRAISPVIKPEGGLWHAVIMADPAYYQVMADRGLLDPDVIRFPATPRRRRVPLNKPEVYIGRRSTSRRVLPEIDLAGPPEDPAVSHLHAVLLARPGGTWVVVDVGSTNGTTINGTDDPIERDREVPLHDGDRIYVGAWTVITVQRG